jgi:hypothetical protein
MSYPYNIIKISFYMYNRKYLAIAFVIASIFGTTIVLTGGLPTNAFGSYYEEDRTYEENYENSKYAYNDNSRDYGYGDEKDYEYGYDRDNKKRSDDNSGVFVTKMTGEDQIPPNDSPAFGFAKVEIEKNPVTFDTELWYKVSLFDFPRGDDVNAIHLHVITDEPLPGLEPHIITLCGNPLNEIACPEGPGVVVAGAATDDDIEPNTAGITTLEDFIEAMKAGETYVNVHSTDFGGEGEIRGVLVPKY